MNAFFSRSAAPNAGHSAQGSVSSVDLPSPAAEDDLEGAGRFVNGSVTRLNSHNVNDQVFMHLLMETAIEDSQRYEILSPEEVDTLKRELANLSSRIEATGRKLVLESKIRDATQSINRFGSHDLDGRRNVELHTTDDVAESARKCEEVAKELSRLEKQQQAAEKRLLGHTARVLQVTHKGYSNKASGLEDSRGEDGELDGEASDQEDFHYYRPYSDVGEDGIIKLNATPNTEVAEQSKMIYDVEKRVKDLNVQIREMIIELDRREEDLPSPVPETRDDPSNPGVMLKEQITYLGRCFQTIHRLHKEQPTGGHGLEEFMQICVKIEQRIEAVNDPLRAILSDLQPRIKDLPNPARRLSADPNNPTAILLEQIELVEQSLETIHMMERDNSNALNQAMRTLGGELYQTITKVRLEVAPSQPPPTITEGREGLQDQLDYLTTTVDIANHMLMELSQAADSSTSRLGSHQERVEQYESTVEGLWDLLTSTETVTEERTSFSLQAFSAKVQDIHMRLSALQTQKEVLTRQIQQQRELNATSDAAKDTQLVEMREELNRNQEVLTRQIQQQRELNATSGSARDIQIVEMREELNRNQEQLHMANKQLETTSQEATLHLERLRTTVAELEAARGAAASHQAQLEEAKSSASAMEVNALTLKSDLETRTQEHAKAESSTQELERKVAQLQTELTIARADLDSMYGTKAQRAAEKAADPQLVARVQTLEKELSETIADYEAMTKATIEYEKEREQQENLADNLRNRIEALENQLNDERIQSLGLKSPGPAGGERGFGGATSAGVLKMEFKKMMRESKAEYSKALRAEQEERRRLESLLRSLKKDQQSKPIARADSSAINRSQTILKTL